MAWQHYMYELYKERHFLQKNLREHCTGLLDRGTDFFSLNFSSFIKKVAINSLSLQLFFCCFYLPVCISLWTLFHLCSCCVSSGIGWIFHDLLLVAQFQPEMSVVVTYSPLIMNTVLGCFFTKPGQLAGRPLFVCHCCTVFAGLPKTEETSLKKRIQNTAAWMLTWISIQSWIQDPLISFFNVFMVLSLIYLSNLLYKYAPARSLCV